ncbi:hypothetical protein QBC46DRAFT_127585 [Diplogelasinospora grovesii]|uniref:Phosphoglycerate mutase n=1 Tax=Diplogelasinospora grovesii TaxID=303347 RepID=A0AAN6N7X4_9PEZI|nr:hypothetical protein QBC46DRAFT_127585 [Diplogelasinospora grovesii]
MGRPPAYIFVVRHGARLDAADKQWHLTSPTPYDPPLTYGGWQQTKQLGARIGSIIRERVLEDEAAEKQSLGSGVRPKRKRYKVALHSSPFLRCIQTSIAISAGLAQDPAPWGPSNSKSKPPVAGESTSPRSKPTVVTDVRDSESQAAKPNKSGPIRKSVLRLDAFLGEWLSPTYFELITPPPASVMMLAGAKADLLKREDYTSYPTFNSHAHSNSQGQLWSPVSRSIPVSPPGGGAADGFDDMAGLANSLSRSASLSSQDSRWTPGASSAKPGGYVAPVPHYAVSHNHPIPMGYVAHARDACVDIDYQWDSMREPLEWGDGGTFPEEWTEMHQRFRKGIQSLVDWYSSTENPTEMVTKTAAYNLNKSRGGNVACAEEDLDDVETETIVILVSHGAGCNALIGAITHRPVLMDVGMASLTMAVRKPVQDGAEDGMALPGNGHTKESIPVHRFYDLKLFADTDHLRSPAPTPTSSRSPSTANMVSGTRGRYANSFSTTLGNFSYTDGSASRSVSANDALSNLRRGSNTSPGTPRLAWMTNGTSGGGITVGSGVTSFATTRPSGLSRTPSIGLWSPITARGENAFEDDDEDDMLLNFSHEKHVSPANNSAHPAPNPSPLNLNTNTNPPPRIDREVELPPATTGSRLAEPFNGTAIASPISYLDSTEPAPLPSPGVGSGGLWGGEPRLPGEAERLRDHSSTKRRWTVTERG